MYWYTLLDEETLVALKEPAKPDGKAELHIGAPGVMPVVQTIDGTLACGDAWENGPTLALLTRAGQLYVVDRRTRRLVERPHCRPAAAAAIRSTPGLWRIAYSGSCIITQDNSTNRLRLFGVDGSTLELRIIDANRQWPDGSPRLLPPGGLTGGMAWLGVGSSDQLASALRREGRRAPLTTLAGDIGNNLLPIGKDRFVVADSTYLRLTVIEHTPRQPPADNSGEAGDAPLRPAAARTTP
jgi:hypothetical protein